MKKLRKNINERMNQKMNAVRISKTHTMAPIIYYHLLIDEEVNTGHHWFVSHSFKILIGSAIVIEILSDCECRAN